MSQLALGRSTTLGFMADWLDPGYQQVILRGVLAAAHERDFKVICYVTSSSAGTPFDVTATHELIGAECVDGLVVAAPSLEWGSESSPASILGPLRCIPMCFVAAEVPQASAVVVDNELGFSMVVRHLVRDHGYRRLAFVRGPEFNAEAEQRLATFRAVLAEAGLPVIENLILPGDFSIPAGERAVDILLGERKVSISDVDAIVAANDGMAMGVLEKLASRGVRVPAHVALTGFDDCADSRYLRTPLTTVRQPLFDQGKEAVRALTEQIRTGEPQRRVLRTELVVRRSCGCFDGITRVSFSGVRNVSGLKFDAALLERRQTLLSELMRAGRGAFGMLGAGWELKLVTSLVEEIKERSPDAFRVLCEDMLRCIAEAGVDPAAFHEIVSVLWRNLAPCAAAEPELRSAVEATLDEARMATATAVQRVQGAERIKQYTTSQAFASACTKLCSASSFEHLGRSLQEYSSVLGISRLDIALYAAGKRTETALRVLTYADGWARPASGPVRARELPHLVQSEEAGGQGLLVTSLEFDAETLGLVVMNLGAGAGQFFEPLRASLSVAVKTVQLRERLRQLGG